VQAIPSLQLGADPPHAPATHESNVVHVKPSLQGVPSGLSGSEQVPVAGSQVPAL
jgi:hypothetical protein